VIHCVDHTTGEKNVCVCVCLYVCVCVCMCQKINIYIVVWCAYHLLLLPDGSLVTSLFETMRPVHVTITFYHALPGRASLFELAPTSQFYTNTNLHSRASLQRDFEKQHDSQNNHYYRVKMISKIENNP